MKLLWLQDKPQSNNWCSSKKRRAPKRNTKKKCCVRSEAEIGYPHKPSNARDCGNHQKLGRSKKTRRDYVYSLPCQCLDFKLLASRTVRKQISLVLCHQIYGFCYGSPSKLIQLLKILAHQWHTSLPLTSLRLELNHIILPNCEETRKHSIAVCPG